MSDNLLEKQIDLFYENYNGAEDLRSDEEKALDYNQKEFVASANPVMWVEKKLEDWRSFPVMNQFYTYKCVAFTTAKLALINFWLKTKEFLMFSPNSIYDYRINKPQGGMIGDDAFGIWKDKGISLYSVAKSDQVQETEPTELSRFAVEVAKGFKLGSYITIDNGDFDRVASTIETTGKGIMLWFYFTSREWSLAVPRVIDNLANPYVAGASRHSVAGVDNGKPKGFIGELAIVNGVQVIKIEDSAHFGGINVRYITREFFNARNFLAKYPMNFNYEEQETIPSYVFTEVMKMGSKSPEVKKLQEKLQALGFYPTNIGTDEIFGSITKKAVMAFQTSRQLVSDGIVGKNTLAELNKL